MKNSFSALFRMATVSLCAVLVLSLAACGDKPSTSSDGDISAETTSASKSSKTKKPKTTTATTSAASDKTTTTAGGGATQQVATTQKKTTTKATESYWKKTTKAETPLSKYNLKAADYILNPQLHKTKYFGGSKAYSHVRWQGPYVDSSSGWYSCTDDLINYSLEEYGFYIDQIFFPTQAAEWGYFFHNLEPNKDYGLYGLNGNLLLPDVGYRLEKPKSRRDALRIIKDWFFKQYEYLVKLDAWDSCPGYYLYGPYTADWGCTSLGAEIGENICHTQASMAFTRGAARQYQLPYYFDISPWFDNVHNAHSASLSHRQAMAGYMGGAAFILAEGGPWTMFGNNITDDYVLELNELGVAFKKVVDFMEKYPNVGYTYTPIGLVFDYYHGMTANYHFPMKSFGYFPYEAGDYMSRNLLDMFFPGGWGSAIHDESNYLVNGPYGDTADALLQNASQEVLNSYPCLILSGMIEFENWEVNRYVNYVKQGGTLVLNTAYLKFFPAYKKQYSGTGTKEITDGKGTVIVYGPDYDITALDGIIRQQLTRFVPFTVSGKIEYMFNVKDGTFYVTLINNEGYTKRAKEEAPVVDNSKKQNVTVTYTGNLAIKGVSEIYDNNKVSLNGKSVSITVKPGEIKVLEFKFD